MRHKQMKSGRAKYCWCDGLATFYIILSFYMAERKLKFKKIKSSTKPWIQTRDIAAFRASAWQWKCHAVNGPPPKLDPGTSVAVVIDPPCRGWSPTPKYR